MHNDHLSEHLLNEARKDLKKQKILNLLNKYKYLLAGLIILAAILITIYYLITAHINKIADQNSVVFNEVQEKLMSGDTDSAFKLLTNLENKGTNGYKLIAVLQEASLNLHNNDYKAAINTFKKIENLNVPAYYKDLATFTIFSLRLDHEKDLAQLIKDIKSKLSPNNTFYYAELELYTIALLETKNYNTALETANQIINADNASVGIKERVKGLKSIVLAYVK